MIGLIRNAFYDGFADPCAALARAFGELGEDTAVYTNLELSLLEDDAIPFRKAVFLDKDIPLGLRLERLGVRLYNRIDAIERCDDKRRTQALLEGVCPMPKTFIFPLAFHPTQTALDGYAKTVLDALGLPLVAKEAYGSLGEQVKLIQTEQAFYDYLYTHVTVPHLYQRFCAQSAGRDKRVYVVGDHAVAAMERFNPTDFRANLALGGTARAAKISDREKALAETAVQRLGLDFGGVDLLFGDGGEPLLCEVNSNAQFAGISRACGVDVAAEIARYVVRN